MRAALVVLALAAIIACSPACTTTAPEAGIARGLFMCTCGEVYLMTEEGGKIVITKIDRSTGVDLDPGGLNL